MTGMVEVLRAKIICRPVALGKQSWNPKFREKLCLFWGFGADFRGILGLFYAILRYITLYHAILPVYYVIFPVFYAILRYITLDYLNF